MNIYYDKCVLVRVIPTGDTFAIQKHWLSQVKHSLVILITYLFTTL